MGDKTSAVQASSLQASQQAAGLQPVQQAQCQAGQMNNQAQPSVQGIVAAAMSEPTEAERLTVQLRQKLAATLVSYDTEVEPEQYALSVDGVGFFSLRDIHGVKAKQKNGKSSALKVCAAALLSGQQFRVRSELTAPKVLWLDTEQNRSDVKLITTDIIGMTGLDPDLVRQMLHVHALRCCEYADLQPLMLQAIEDFLPQVVIVDGIVEFVLSFNDEAIAKQLVHDLQVVSQKYSCAVVAVLHTNKAEEDRNMRGHLGSMLAQKAGTVLECRKEQGVITVSCSDSRHAEMPSWSICYDAEGRICDADQQRQQWLEQRRAEQQQRRDEANAEKQRERLSFAHDTIAGQGGSISRKQLQDMLCEHFEIERSTASKFIKAQIEAKTLFEDKESKTIFASCEQVIQF